MTQPITRDQGSRARGRFANSGLLLTPDPRPLIPTPWMRIAALFLLLTLASPLHALAQDSGEQSISTKYFTIYYPRGEETTAKWYASFADDVNSSVSDMLGVQSID